MALSPTGLEQHPAGTVNPNSIINGNWATLNAILANVQLTTVNAFVTAPSSGQVVHFKIPFGCTVEEVYGRTDAGTVDVTTQVNGTNTTGGAGSCTAGGASFACTALNAIVAGDILSVTLGTVTTAVTLAITLKLKRTY